MHADEQAEIAVTPRPSEDVPSEPVAQILTHEGRSIAVIDLGRYASDALRASWSEDRPFQSGGIIDSAWLQPVLGTGSTASSSLLAGNVYLATGDHATLMSIRNGVGSAVIGQGGRIVRHAQFVPVKSALVPVLTPVMLFMTVSSAVMSARLDHHQESLEALADMVERVRDLLEAEDYGRIESAAERIDEIRSEFQAHGAFASDVGPRLQRAGEDVSTLSRKYGRLVSSAVNSVESARKAVNDLRLLYLASLCDIQIDVLQLYLVRENDPEFLGSRLSLLREKVGQYAESLRKVREEDRIGEYRRKLKSEIAGSRLAKLRRAVPRRFRKERARKRKANVSGTTRRSPRSGLRKTADVVAQRIGSALMEGALHRKLANVRRIGRDADRVEADIDRWVEVLETVAKESDQQSVVFFREPDGERALRAYHTSDIRLEGGRT